MTIIEQVAEAAERVAQLTHSGYPESVYQEALANEIRRRTTLPCSTEVGVQIVVEGTICGTMRADILVGNRYTPTCIVECKALPCAHGQAYFDFTVEHRNQLFAYMLNLNCATGVLVNFQQAKYDLSGGGFHTKVHAVSCAYVMASDGKFSGALIQKEA